MIKLIIKCLLYDRFTYMLPSGISRSLDIFRTPESSDSSFFFSTFGSTCFSQINYPGFKFFLKVLNLVIKTIDSYPE